MKGILGSDIDPQVTEAGRTFDIRHNTADIDSRADAAGLRAEGAAGARASRELVEWAKTTPDVATDFFDKAFDELQQKGLLIKS